MLYWRNDCAWTKWDWTGVWSLTPSWAAIVYHFSELKQWKYDIFIDFNEVFASVAHGQYQELVKRHDVLETESS